MTTLRHVTITGNSTTRSTKVHVNGQDWSPLLHRVEFRQTSQDLGEVLLGMWARPVEIDTHARVTVDDATRDALITLGWTPPAEETR